jgi:serine phosphatase RsbU (regulator of sigma subunit)
MVMLIKMLSRKLQNIPFSLKEFTITILILATSGKCLNAQNPDSLYHLHYKSKSDTIKIQLLSEISGYYFYKNFDSAISIAQRGLKMATAIGDKKGKAVCLLRIGSAYGIMGNYPAALNNCLQALQLYEENKDNKGISKTSNNIGYIYLKQKNNAKALEYLELALNIDQDILKDTKSSAYKLWGIGIAYLNEKNYTKALDYLNKALKIDENYNNKNTIPDDLLYIARAYLEMGDFTDALKILKKGLKLAEELNNKESISGFLCSYAMIYNKTGKPFKGIEFGIQALKKAQEIKSLQFINESALSLYDSYFKLNDYKNALHYYKMAASAKDSMFNISSQMEFNRFQYQNELNKKQKELDLSEKNRNLAQQEVILLGVSCIIIGLFTLFIFRFFKKEQRSKTILIEKNKEINKKNEILGVLNEEILSQRNHLQSLHDELFVKNEEISLQLEKIEKQHKEIHNQKSEIEIKNKNIVDSIVYASSIQNALLPSKDKLNKHFPDNFVLNKPRDIVSGDFYWVKEINSTLFFAVADCSGHGVPGAFMSILGISLLNEIVSENQNNISLEPGIILGELRQRVKLSLHQTTEKYDTQDGMDISFCQVDLNNFKLKYAGAHNPAYIIRNSDFFLENSDYLNPEDNPNQENKLIVLKADRMPIGVHPIDIHCFTTQEFQLKKGDSLYLFSDGYVSQFGGTDDKKFKTAHFQDLLMKIQDRSMKMQEVVLDQMLVAWQGEQEQVDDILILGIRINKK